MKLKTILFAGLSLAGTLGVVYYHKVKLDLINSFPVSAYNGMEEQIRDLDKRIKKEESDLDFVERLNGIRNSITDNREKFYLENQDELREAQDKIYSLDKTQWFYLAMAGVGIAGLVFGRRKEIKEL